MAGINSIDFRAIAEGRALPKQEIEKDDAISSRAIFRELGYHNSNLPKGKSRLRSDLVENLDRVIGEMEDYDLSNVMMKYKDDLIGDVSYIQALLDKYAYVIRNNSVKEKIKFFMGYKPSQEEYFNLLQNRFILISYLIIDSKKIFNYERLDDVHNSYFDFKALEKLYERVVNPKILTMIEATGQELVNSHRRELSSYLKGEELDKYAKMLACISLYVNMKYRNEGGAETFKLNSYFILNGVLCKERYKLLDYGNNKDIIILTTYINTLINFIETRNLNDLSSYIKLDMPCISYLKDIYLISTLDFKNDALDNKQITKTQAKFTLNVKDVLDDLEYRILYDSLTQPMLSSLKLYKGNKRYLSLNSHTVFDSSEFYHRKVLLPNSGVLIVTKNDDVTESILVREMHQDYNSLLSVCVRLKSGLEHSCVIPLSNSKFGKVFICSETDDSMRSFVDYIFDLLGMGDFLELAKNHGLDTGEEIRKLEYEVLAPVYWKYRDRNYLSPKETDSISRGMKLKREFSIDIAPYIRKINGEPSKEALDLARRISLTLEPGHTVVKPHTRTYNKTNKMNIC